MSGTSVDGYILSNENDGKNPETKALCKELHFILLILLFQSKSAVRFHSEIPHLTRYHSEISVQEGASG